jgi:hypothetical protein
MVKLVTEGVCMIRIIVLSLLLSACANHNHVPVTATPDQLTEFEHYCMQMFRSILIIQGERDANNVLMNEVTDSYRDSEISREEHAAFFEKWKAVEDQMRTKVTALYDVAYDEGCFDTSPAAKNILRWRKM